MRIQQNLEVIKAISQKNFNPEILEKYTGFGGIGRELAEYDYYKELSSVIPKQKIAEIKATTKTAYYTPELLVKFIYQALGKLGFKGGNILEPAAGTGAFIKHMPKTIKENSKILAIETEPVAYSILKALHPNIATINKNFEDVAIKDDSVDLVIGNPPYGKWTITDKKNPDLAKHAIHHYFASRGVRLLKKGGILAFVINQYFMDNIRDHVRDVIAKEGGSLLATYRLPETLFDNAKVTTDIIFIVKDKLSTKWQKTKPITVNKQTKQINEYFINNPQNILGKLNIIPMYERTGLVCQADGELETKLKTCLDKLPVKYLQKNNIQNYLTANLKSNIEELRYKANKKLEMLCRGIHIIKTKFSVAEIALTYIDKDYSLDKTYQVIENDTPEEEHYFEIKCYFTGRLFNTTQEIHFERVVENFIKELLQKHIQHQIYFYYG